MKDYANPFLLLVVVALFALLLQAPSGEGGAVDPALWLLVLCATGCVVNGALCLSRALTRRSALACAVWSLGYLVLGCAAWVHISRGDEADAALRAGYADLRAVTENPTQTDAAGECLLTYAAALGKTRAVRRLLEHPAAAAQPQVAELAALRAAENGHTDVLKLLVPARVGVNAAPQGLPLLAGAAVNGAVKAAELLLSLGAAVDAADADGYTPLMHAAINGDVPMSRLLLQHGASPQCRNAQGQSAADLARGEVAELPEMGER